MVASGASFPAFAGLRRSIPFAAEAATVLLFVLTALAIRLYGIGDHSLWVDEAASLAFAEASWYDLFVTNPLTETNPPGYYALLKLWIGAFGTSEMSLRMPSALAGALAVVPLYLIARRAAGQGAALIAAALFALSAIQVEYAQEARTFAVMTLAFLLALWSGGRIVDAHAPGRQDALAGVASGASSERRGPGAGLLATFVASGAALPYLHYTAFLALGAVYVFVLTRALLEGSLRWPLLRDLVLCGLATLMLTGPALYWVVVLLNGGGAVLVDWIPHRTATDAFRIYRAVFGFSDLPYTDRHSGGLLAWLASPRTVADFLLGALCAWGLWASIRARRWHAVAALAALFFVATSYFLVSQIRPILLPRVIVYATPLVMLAAVIGLAAISSRRLGLAAGVLLIGFSGWQTHRYLEQPEKEPWRTAIAEAATLHTPGTRVLFLSLLNELSGHILVRAYWPGFEEEAGSLVLPGEVPPLFPFLEEQAPPQRHVLLEDLCTALSGAEGLVVIERRAAAEEAFIENVHAAMRATGAHMIKEQYHGNQDDDHVAVGLWSAPSACSMR
jgi:4-amino-4-deoxy-L-arabinose transferase-like glycosyltransferase